MAVVRLSKTSKGNRGLVLIMCVLLTGIVILTDVVSTEEKELDLLLHDKTLQSFADSNKHNHEFDVTLLDPPAEASMLTTGSGELNQKPAPNSPSTLPQQLKPQETQNDDLAIILFTHLSTTDRFDNLIFPALETWWTSGILYIVMTHQWKPAYDNMCLHKDCRRLHILWVDCPEGGFGESPCCKQEQGLLAFLRLSTPHQYIVFADDDMYFKTDSLRRYLFRFLGATPDQIFIVTAGGISAKALGQWGYKGRLSPYKCSDWPEYRYPWGQPVVYSRAALQYVQSGLAAGGLTKQCREFNVTHDAGNPIFHWMYGLPDYVIKFHMFPTGGKVKSEMLGVHGIHRYRSDVNRVVTMYDVHNQALNRSKVSFKRYMNQRHERLGYLQTETYAKYGHPSQWKVGEWHTLPLDDCMDPDMKKKKQS